MAQSSEYPFALLDVLVEIQLNPELSPQVKDLSEAEFAEIKEQFSAECDKIWTQLKAQTFALNSEENIKITVDQHLLIISHLKNQLATNLTALIHEPYYQCGYDILIGLLDKLERFIRNRYKSYLTDSTPPKLNFKIRCALSVDQIGLILKSADDTQLIEAKSLNYVFKAIVPYLSTEHKTDISYDSMRVSTYHPEAPDKEKAIAVLEKMIARIRTYR
jgi:hypothetical protein